MQVIYHYQLLVSLEPFALFHQPKEWINPRLSKFWSEKCQRTPKVSSMANSIALVPPIPEQGETFLKMDQQIFCAHKQM